MFQTTNQIEMGNINIGLWLLHVFKVSHGNILYNRLFLHSAKTPMLLFQPLLTHSQNKHIKNWA